MSETDRRIRRVGRVKAVVVAAAIASSVAASGALALQSELTQGGLVNGTSTSVTPQGQGGLGISIGSGGPTHATTQGS